MPNITGSFQARAMSDNCGTIGRGTDAFKTTYNGSDVRWENNIIRGTGNRYTNDLIEFYANLSSAIYGASSTVQPPALAAKFLIKY